VAESFIECLKCGLFFKPYEAFLSSEDEKQRYSLHNNSVEDESYLNYLEQLVDLIPSLEGPVLDFGCGPTKGLEFLLKKRNFKDEVESYDPYFFNKDLEEKKFKTVYASECFEHFNKPFETISEIKNLMSPHSLLAIRTELYSYELGPINEWWYFKDPTHVCFYTQKTFNWIAESFDFELSYIKSPNILLSLRS
jgi:hypothetical protein